MNYRDLLERIIWTAVQSAGATLIAAGAIEGLEIWHAAAIAGLSGAITVITTAARNRLNALDS
jgi:hypothetical protein